MAFLSRINKKFWLCLMLILLLGFAFVYRMESDCIREQTARIAELNAQKTVKVEENAKLERKIAFSKTDDYVDRMARSELGMIGEGEIRFTFSEQ